MYEVMVELIGSFAGAMLGIPAGMELNRQWQQEVDQAKKQQFIGVLRSAVGRVFDEAQLLAAWLVDQNADGAPMATLDSVVLDSTATTKYEVLGDLPTCEAIDKLRFQISVINTELDILRRLEFDPVARRPLYDRGAPFLHAQKEILVVKLRAQLPALNSLVNDALVGLGRLEVKPVEPEY